MNGHDEQTELLRQIRTLVRIIMWLLIAPFLIALVALVLNNPIR